MELSYDDLRVLHAIQDGLPLVPRPYAHIGAALGMAEADVLARVHALLESGVIKRLGVVVRHHELGYRANAMTVWDVPDAEVAAMAARMLEHPAVTLCYRRPRQPPDWPYNLFCMIHGRERGEVQAQVETLRRDCGLDGVRHAVLFSRRRFKQRGARYPLAAAARDARVAEAPAAHG
jgi:DNA-binding Lrp family transcriptional regulator